MNKVKKNLQDVDNRLKKAAETAGRDADEVRLIAVSKKHPAELIEQAYQAGQREFGENYLQEALQKIDALKHLPDIRWHFIGSIQSNKTRALAEHFDWVHSVDRLKIARRLSEQRPTNLPPLNICLEVNVSAEASKSGISLQQTAELAEQVHGLANINLRGLMAIPVQTEDVNEQRRIFAAMREQLELLNQSGYQMDTLSMGMSNDMEAAILEGATMIRVGTAIFGKRDNG